jgi:hypothetical protein
LRIDLVGTTANFRRFRSPQPLPINHLLGENCGTQGRIGEVGLAPICRARRALKGREAGRLALFIARQVEQRIAAHHGNVTSAGAVYVTGLAAGHSTCSPPDWITIG